MILVTLKSYCTASLEEEYEKVNTALIELEDVIEEKELLTAQVIDTQKLSEYNQRKQDELENCKSKTCVIFFLFISR